MMTAKALRSMWESSVRSMTGVDDYKCWGFDKVFDRVTAFLNERLDISPEKYVRAQIQWVIGRNIEGGIIPSLLSGEKALERYKLLPNDEAEKQLAGSMLAWEYETWKNITANLDVSLALTNPVRAHTPLFLAYMHHLAERDFPGGLVGDALSQLYACPAYRDVLPAEFLERLNEQK